MEIYVFTALILVYVVTAFLVDKIIVRRIWTLAFIVFVFFYSHSGITYKR